MPHYNFVKDKALGDQAEDVILEILQKAGYSEAHRVKGKEVKWDIIIPEVNKTIEVKNDLKAAQTKNLAIELFKKNGEPSGLMASEADIWVIFANSEILMMKREALKDYCSAAKHRIVFGGDKNSTQMMLVPLEDIKKEDFCKKLG